MRMEEITNVKQTKNVDEVNELLAKGYKIVKILSSKSSTGGGEEIIPIYILGLTKHAI